ncbi:hypothetical protein L226DRAFT_616137 [Lentinus tigrinus ALCF2SS1-7]|uniref:Uncharacterized protein n=1 Tax=Lentinus tigrinus ALCF2SS1-6 TaxID=1328759 RepID=A0A5C2S2Y4_9APHY|nr:hypothetical protein L227DRAFT_655200 [Lentinus tigrinus ALCF2SS1-6]RPD70413.1 hypothetical protein L226DRAFT_616137 [Lentinus tigrinus ALCF2SS1-7]
MVDVYSDTETRSRCSTTDVVSELSAAPINDPAPPVGVRDLGKVFAPTVRTYAAIRMDPQAMVEDHNDPEALKEAQLMSPKTYLVFVHMAVSLPWPGNSYFEYRVSPIAPRLRAEKPQSGITSDMAVPIYPSTSHPSGRPPVHTDPQFPFSNCYHWLKCFVDVHVRANLELFDHDEAVVLPAPSYHALQDAFSQDNKRIADTLKDRNVSSPQPILDSPPEEDVWPLVDMWFNLTEHLSGNPIPDPEDLLKERETISGIIRRSNERKAAREAADCLSETRTEKHSNAHDQSEEHISSSQTDSEEPRRKRRSLLARIVLAICAHIICYPRPTHSG